MTQLPVGFDAVREVGLELPNVVESTMYGAPALKANGQLLACVPVNKSAEPNSAVFRIDLRRRAALLAANPEIYYVTDHYAGYPTVLVRLSRVDRAVLRNLFEWSLQLASSAKGAGAPRKRPTSGKSTGRR